MCLNLADGMLSKVSCSSDSLCGKGLSPRRLTGHYVALFYRATFPAAQLPLPDGSSVDLDSMHECLTGE